MDAVRGACAWIRGLFRGLGCLFFLNLHSKRSKFDTSGLMSIDRGGGFASTSMEDRACLVMGLSTR